MNWSSVAVDEERQLMVVQNTHLPFIVKMVPRERDLINNREEQSFSYGIGGPQRGTPFAAEVMPFMVAVPLPCLKPPYGEMAVVDLTTQEIVWRKGNGFLGVGMPSISGGSIITAGGLIFNGSVAFSGFRAVDVYSGEELWSAPMSAASEATPMSYVSPNTGRQFVLVTSPSANPRNATDENVGANSASEAKITAQGGLVTVYGLP